MPVPRAICVVLLSGAYFCASVQIAFAQQPALSPPANRAADRTPDDRTIVLDVVVTDRSGKPVGSLQQQDFTVLDNKKPQPILSFRALSASPEPRSASDSEAPVKAVLVIDEANAGFENASYARTEAEKFLRQNGGELPVPVTLVSLSDTGAAIDTAVTRDGKALAAELHQSPQSLRTIRRSQGIYGAGDRLQLSLKALDQLVAYEAEQPGLKLVIWVSPGWPLLSGPRVDLTPKQEQGIFSSIVNISTALRRSRMILYAVDPRGAGAGELRTSYYLNFVKGVRTANNAELGNLGLQVFAVESGGRVLNSANNVGDEIAECLADANKFYELSFEAAPGDKPDEYHSIGVKIDKPGVEARTRTGYYAEP